jgi:hypothetical protein
VESASRTLPAKRSLRLQKTLVNINSNQPCCTWNLKAPYFPSSGSFFISGTPIGSSSSDGSTSISGKVTQFIPFKNVVGYRGEFFIHPETGAVTRLITHADLRPSDYVSREDRRIDYGPVSVSGNESLLPRGSITYAEMNPVGLNADTSGVVHHMLLSAVYQNYKLGEAR